MVPKAWLGQALNGSNTNVAIKKTYIPVALIGS